VAGLTLGVVGTSRKQDERRLGIHPAHFGRIDAELRRRIFVERGYGERFGVPDAELEELVGGLRTRDELVAECDVVMLPKPLAADLDGFRAGQVLWGWPHVVQDAAMTQAAIDRRLTLIAWEAMNHWRGDGAFDGHVFRGNNELAGYASVLHALALRGTTGAYGRRLSAAVISFGSTGRGAVEALIAQGVNDVTVLTQRDPSRVASPPTSVRLVQWDRDDADPARPVLCDGGGPLHTLLAQHDIVVNCVLQDTDAPLMFVTREELRAFARGSLIVDVSCDEGMGFEWARPTSFAEPMFDVGDGVHYYAVDHSPSYLWQSATWEISEALLPYLPAVMGGGDAWDGDETVRRAIEIRDGVIQNSRVLSFQGRGPEYPHPRAA
jgi:alanine dehydrogenase